MTNSNKVDVSIVMPAFNAGAYLAESISSVVNQTYGNWELFIVDDGSSDGSVDIARRYAREHRRIHVITQEKRRGAAHARNLAIRESRGRFIAFLDSDDIWLPEKLERQVPETIRQNAVLSYTAYRKMDARGNIGPGVVNVPRTVTYKELLNTCVIGCLTAMHDTSRTGKVYMPDVARRQDYGLWLRILRSANAERVNSASTAVAVGINEPLAVYRVHGDGLSNNKIRAAYYQWMVYRQCENLPLLRSLYHFVHYAYHGYRKSKVW